MQIKNKASRFELSPRALDLWNPAIRASTEAKDNTITVYGIIGEDDWYGEGVTLKRIDAALRSIGAQDVVVYINSPGGDMFEGIAIYNRLREHAKKHNVEVVTKVLGMAASAASVIAMAGDQREMAKTGFEMIHNCWSLMAGNRHYLRNLANRFEEFDHTMRDLYAETTGLSTEEIESMMDEETFLSSRSALDKNFITAHLSNDELETVEDEQTEQANSLRRLDAALAKGGMPRTERRELIKNFKSSLSDQAGGGMPSATVPSTQDAAIDFDVSVSDESSSMALYLADSLPK